MLKRDAGDARLIGLHGAAQNAPTAIMRALARIAVARGVSQGRLAELYTAATKMRANSASVATHFAAKKNPRRDTVAAYARILGVPDDYIALVQHGTLPAASVIAWESKLSEHLSSMSAYLQPGAAAKLKDALQSLDAGTKLRALSAYALASLEAQLGTRARSDEKPGIATLVALARAVPGFNAAALRRTDLPHDDYLYVVWRKLANDAAGGSGGAFNFEEASELINVISRYLIAKGIDTTPMLARLRQFVKEHHEK